jgi:hypothetical protein
MKTAVDQTGGVMVLAANAIFEASPSIGSAGNDRL